MSWVTIFVLAAGCYAFKVAGAFVGQRSIPPTARSLLGLLPPALFAGLIAEGTFTDAGSLVLDDRAVGLAAAGLAAYLKAPFAAVVVTGGAVTALIRAVA